MKTKKKERKKHVKYCEFNSLLFFFSYLFEVILCYSDFIIYKTKRKYCKKKINEKGKKIDKSSLN